MTEKEKAMTPIQSLLVKIGHVPIAIFMIVFPLALSVLSVVALSLWITWIAAALIVLALGVLWTKLVIDLIRVSFRQTETEDFLKYRANR